MRFIGYKILRKGLKDSNNVAVTFDDGPHPRFTREIMDILEEKGGAGTFFATGKNLTSNIQLSEEISERGHLIGNHTYTHPHALFSGRGKLYDEISKTKKIIEDISGKPNRFFRPPFGFITPSLLSICRNLELAVILWNVNSKDYRSKPADDIKRKVLKKTGPGSIILFHDSKFSDDTVDYTTSIEALKSVLDVVILRGLKPVTIEDMFGNTI